MGAFRHIDEMPQMDDPDTLAVGGSTYCWPGGGHACPACGSDSEPVIEDATEERASDGSAVAFLTWSCQDCGERHVRERWPACSGKMAGDRQVFGPGGTTYPLSEFDFVAWDECGTLWETIEPGVDPEETWQGWEHEKPSLTLAVQSILPEYTAYGLTLPAAAKLLLRLDLIRGTGAATTTSEE